MSRVLPRAFDPLELTREASLNGTLLADLPGAEADWVGRTPMHLTSLPALLQRASAAGLGTSGGSLGVAHIRDALAAGDPCAVTVVQTLGRGLGHLIATLLAAPAAAPYNPASPPGGSAAPSAWRAAYLQHWARVERVWLGGGLSAALGVYFVEAARAEVERLGVVGCPVEVAPFADKLALIGAARSRRRAPRVGVVLDFGGSSVKRAIALARGGVLQRLEVLSPRLTPAAAGVPGFMVDAIADTFVEAERNWGGVDPNVFASLASYIVDRRPVSAHGSYAVLEHVERGTLEAELHKRTGVALHVEYVHDGTAAARGLKEPGRAGVIVVGTYLAAGFPPPPGRLAPMASDFEAM